MAYPQQPARVVRPIRDHLKDSTRRLTPSKTKRRGSEVSSRVSRSICRHPDSDHRQNVRLGGRARRTDASAGTENTLRVSLVNESGDKTAARL